MPRAPGFGLGVVQQTPQLIMSESSVLPTAGIETPSSGEGCPAPLDWQEVLTAFREQRDEFQLSTSWGDIALWEFGRGTPLCFLADAAGDLELFSLTAWLLKDHHRCLLVTFPDPPESVAREHWLPGTAELLVQTWRSRDYGSVPIYGAGYGGLIALQAALDRPDIVDRLMLQGCRTDCRWTFRERLLLALGRRSARRLRDVPLWNRVVESNHRRWFPPFDGSRWEFLRKNLAGTSARSFARRMTAAEQPMLSARLEMLSAPVLLVRTEGEGRRATASQELLAAALLRAEVEWMHSTGQFPYVTHPHRLVKLIRSFIETDDKPAN